MISSHRQGNPPTIPYLLTLTQLTADDIDRRLAEYATTLKDTNAARAIERYVPNLPTHARTVKLADGLPTPVTPPAISESPVWIKRDDLTSTLYGGNKVRKLEFLLDRPARHGWTVLSGGGSASHHIIASVLYCRLLGIDAEFAVFNQPDNPTVAVLQRLTDATGTKLYRMPGPYWYPAALAAACAKIAARGRFPMLLPPGGSTPHGVLGYVDSALEIADSVTAGDCPEPDIIFCALGSGGTAVGLALGLELAGLQSRVFAVSVADATANNKTVLRAIESGARGLLAVAGTRVPSALDRLTVSNGYFGAGYGEPTAAGAAAIETGRHIGIHVDQTYTAKALAAALDHAYAHPTQTTMFVNTLSETGV